MPWFTVNNQQHWSGNELDANLEKDIEKDLDDSGPEIEGNGIDTRHRQQIEEETASKAPTADSDPDSWSESEHNDSVLDDDYRPEKDYRPDNDSDADTPQHSEEEMGVKKLRINRNPVEKLYVPQDKSKQDVL